MDTTTQQLMRSRSERMIAGVAGGIAHYLDVDPVLIRLLFVGLAFTPIGFPLYVILMIIMPEATGAANAPAAPITTQLNPDDIPVRNIPTTPPADAQARRNRTFGYVLLGLGIFFVLKLVLPVALMPFLVPTLLIGGGIWLLRRVR